MSDDDIDSMIEEITEINKNFRYILNDREALGMCIKILVHHLREIRGHQQW